MNCIKCPIAEECDVSRSYTLSDYLGGVIIPTVMKPYNIEDCPLLQVIATMKVEELKGGEHGGD